MQSHQGGRAPTPGAVPVAWTVGVQAEPSIGPVPPSGRHEIAIDLFHPVHILAKDPEGIVVIPVIAHLPENLKTGNESNDEVLDRSPRLSMIFFRLWCYQIVPGRMAYLQLSPSSQNPALTLLRHDR